MSKNIKTTESPNIEKIKSYLAQFLGDQLKEKATANTNVVKVSRKVVKKAK